MEHLRFMGAEYQLEFRVSGFRATQAIATNNPFVVLYHVLVWASALQLDVSGVTIRRNQIPF